MARIAKKDQDTGQKLAWNEGQTPFGGEYKSFPFELPYYVLLPRKSDITNLLVPNCPSVSHVTFSAIREEPTLWQLGRSAGIAAMHAGKGNISVQDVDVKLIQQELVRQKAVYHWPEKTSCP